MPVFRPRNRIEILRDMVARVIARSRLKGLTRTAAVYHVLAASADEDAEQYFQMARLRDVFSIDKATGSDLDERAAEIQPGLNARLDALFATSFVAFSRQGTVGLLSYPAGAVVAASDVQGQITYRASGPVTINPGNTTSDPVPVTCTIAGERGNVVAGQINRLVTRIPGVISVTNPNDITNGRSREKDPDFRARLKSYVRSLARGTVLSLETGARNARLSDGARVLFASVYEDPFVNGEVVIYIDDGTGLIDTFDSSFIGPLDVLIASAIGGERRVFTTNKPIRDDGSFALFVNAVPQTRNVDYVLDQASGQVTFTLTSYPTGLAPADAVTANYRSYTRLIREAQRIIDGDPLFAQTYPGIRAAGVHVRVLPPQLVAQTLNAGIVVADGYDTVTVGGQVETAISDYINNLNIGEDVILAEIIQRAMDVEGMLDISISNLSGSTPPTNQIIAEFQVARIASADINLV